jgi:hypothetical protein
MSRRSAGRCRRNDRGRPSEFARVRGARAKRAASLRGESESPPGRDRVARWRGFHDAFGRIAGLLAVGGSAGRRPRGRIDSYLKDPGQADTLLCPGIPGVGLLDS